MKRKAETVLFLLLCAGFIGGVAWLWFFGG